MGVDYAASLTTIMHMFSPHRHNDDGDKFEGQIMSYSVSIPICRMEDFPEVVKAALDAYDWAHSNPDGEQTARNAGEVATIIVGKGLIANPGGYLSGYIGGHGNPSHDNEGTGYVRDTLTITLSQAAAPATER